MKRQSFSFFKRLLAWLGVFRFRLLLMFFSYLAASITCDARIIDYASAQHPLQPLSKSELILLRNILSGSNEFSVGTNFSWIQLKEPSKTEIASCNDGAACPRIAELTAIDYETKRIYKVLVDLVAKAMVVKEDTNDLQPGFNSRDSEIAQNIVNGDLRIKSALKKRGLKIPGRVTDAVYISYTSAGRMADSEKKGGSRLMRVTFGAGQNSDKQSFQSVTGLHVIVDLFSKSVKLFRDDIPSDNYVDHTNLTLPNSDFEIPTDSINRRSEYFSMPLRIEEFTISWANWRVNYGFNLREGLVLYGLAFKYGQKIRQIANRLSVSEVLTSYGDLHKDTDWMEYFDESDFGLGYSSAAAIPGLNIPGSARVIDAVLPEPSKPNFSEIYSGRIYIYERAEAGQVYYPKDGQVYADARSQLVIGSMSVFGNYVYAMNWIFSQDGSFSFEVKLGGHVLLHTESKSPCNEMEPDRATRAASSSPSADDHRLFTCSSPVVGGNVVAMNHQHWFNIRVDFDLDGQFNSVQKSNFIIENSKSGNPSFNTDNMILHNMSDRGLGSMVDDQATWTVINSSSRNKLGQPVGYSFSSGERTRSLYTGADSPKSSTAFTQHQVWFTQYRPEEFYCSGEYLPNKVPDPNTNPNIFSKDDLIRNQDIVLWYTLGVNHVPRLEDFPLMPVVTASVTFRPDNFFDTNPLVKP